MIFRNAETKKGGNCIGCGGMVQAGNTPSLRWVGNRGSDQDGESALAHNTGCMRKALASGKLRLSDHEHKYLNGLEFQEGEQTRPGAGQAPRHEEQDAQRRMGPPSEQAGRTYGVVQLCCPHCGGGFRLDVSTAK